VRDYRARTKVALKLQGVIESTVMRPPLTEIGEDSAAAIRGALATAGLLTPAGVAGG
jgi:dihydrodipicolinate synthase/N-acetylneuraminate lyase